MKEESNKAFRLGFGHQGDNIIRGRLLDAHVVCKGHSEAGAPYHVLEFWLKPELTPDYGAQMSDTVAVADCNVKDVELPDVEKAADILRALDAGMIYIYSQCGLDNARLVKQNGELVFVDMDADTISMEVDEGLEWLASIYELRTQLFSSDWDQDDLFATFAHFHTVMNFGKSYVGKACMWLPGVVDPVDEDWGDEHDEDAVDSDVVIASQPDLDIDEDEGFEPEEYVKVVCNEKARNFTLSFVLKDKSLPDEVYTLGPSGAINAMRSMRKLAEKLGSCEPEQWHEVLHVYKCIGRADVEGLVADLVEEYSADPRIAAGQAQLFNMLPYDAPGAFN